MKKFFCLLIVVFLTKIIFAQDITRFNNLYLAEVKIVYADTIWTIGSAYEVEVGDTINIICNGTANTAFNPPSGFYSDHWVGPEGTDVSTNPNAPVVDVPAFSVVAKIGENGTPFYIGRSASFRANTSGTMYLGYNDIQFYDNFGYFIAYIFNSRHTTITEVNSNNSSLSLKSYDLKQNYPNPFNPYTTIEFYVNKTSQVRIDIYNSIGELVKNLLDDSREPGYYKITWDGRNQHESLVSSGSYYYQIVLDGYVETKKMLLLK